MHHHKHIHNYYVHKQVSKRTGLSLDTQQLHGGTALWSKPIYATELKTGTSSMSVSAILCTRITNVTHAVCSVLYTLWDRIIHRPKFYIKLDAKIGDYRDVTPSRALHMVVKKLHLTQQKCKGIARNFCLGRGGVQSIPCHNKHKITAAGRLAYHYPRTFSWDFRKSHRSV